MKKKKKTFELGFENLHGSTQPLSFINIEKDLDILEGETLLEDERSRLGSITQFRSPPSTS